MKKYLGIDYGSKKIGLAISDIDGKFAFPLCIISNKNKEESFKKILELLKEKEIKTIVVGESITLKGEANKILEEVKEFVENLKSKTSVEVSFEKEWFSTVEARRFDNRRDADDSAAAIILQRFLDKINNAIIK